MEQNLVQLEKEVPLFAKEAMNAFCDDINQMLGTAMTCSDSEVVRGPLNTLKKPFTKLGVVYSVQSSGDMEGTFHLAFDRKGTFILPGVIVMLPDKRILDHANSGTLEDTRNLADSIGETGNLLIGSWDRIFREQCSSHKHFLRTGTFIGDLWKNTEESFAGPDTLPCLQVTWELSLPGFPGFRCAAVFPDNLFQPASPETSEPQAPEPAPDETPRSDPSADAIETSAPAAPPSEAAPEPVTNAPSDREPVASETETSDVPPSPTEQKGPVAKAIEAMIRSAEVPSLDRSALPILTAPVEHCMNTRVVWCTEEESVENMLHLMQQKNTDYLLVENDQQLIGILSRSDLAAAVSPYLRPAFATYRRPQDDASLQIRIKWFMSRPVQTVPEGTPLYRAMEKMMRSRIRALPVINFQGTVIGMVTVFDIFSRLLSLESQPLSDAKSFNSTVEPEDGKENK